MPTLLNSSPLKKANGLKANNNRDSTRFAIFAHYDWSNKHTLRRTVTSILNSEVLEREANRNIFRLSSSIKCPRKIQPIRFYFCNQHRITCICALRKELVLWLLVQKELTSNLQKFVLRGLESQILQFLDWKQPILTTKALVFGISCFAQCKVQLTSKVIHESCNMRLHNVD